MNRCSNCNNELIAGARFCNICGTPVQGAPATPATPATPAEPSGLKRTIKPEIRRVRPSRAGQAVTGSLLPDAAPVETGTPDKPADSTGSAAPETQAEQEEKKSAPSLWNPPVIPKTTIEYTSIKAGQDDQKHKSTPPEDTPGTTDQAKKGEEVPTSPLPDSPVSAPAKAPVIEAPAQVEATPPAAISDPDKTVPLPPPPDKTVPLPPPGAGASRAPGIIRPIVSSASVRQNMPVPPGYTPPNPQSPLPALPNTPPLTGEKARQTDNARFSRPLNTPAPDSQTQENQRQAGGSQPRPVPVRQYRQPSLNNIPVSQQNRLNSIAPQTPLPILHEMPTSYPGQQHANGNGANSTAARQELPLFSQESFAYTSKAAQHWRNSWRDLQNAEAGPAEDVSKGQAEVSAPLASRKDSFLRMRAIRSKQNSDGGEKNFGFWVTLFLMICLTGGLAAYIVYSYLPGTSVAVHIAQPAGALQPAFNVVAGSPQAFSRGQSLRAHGDHFGANDPIQFLLDSSKPILASTGSPLSVQSDSTGSFDVTILVGKDWTIGAHVLSATDARASLSAYLDIQVNPSSTPIAGNNNTDLAFTLNGQSIDHLSFTAQIGQSAPPAQRITFTNISGAPLQWSAAAGTTQNLNWLTIVDNDFAGQLDISQPHTMGISVNPAGLPVTATGKASYSGQIEFTINGSVLLTLSVQLTIIDAAPEMVFSPNPLVATANANGTCQPGATLTFINLGTTVIHWSANPDLQNIQFVNDRGAVTEQGTLQPSGVDGDTAVVTLRCSGVKVGQYYVVHVYANSIPFTEIVQID